MGLTVEAGETFDIDTSGVGSEAVSTPLLPDLRERASGARTATD
jgi:hypothetical protein